MDWVEFGLFNCLLVILIDYVLEYGIKMYQEGDWVRGEFCIFYFGSFKSMVCFVFYEKGF